jgi:hypothetical protein
MHLRFWRCACSVFLGFLAGACGGDDAKEPASAGADSIKLTNANQYTSTSSLHIPVVDTAATDLSISWSALDKDLLCHDVALPSGIRNLTLLRFQETRAEVAKRLAGNPISASELYDVYYGHKTLGKSTSAMLSDFATLTGSKTLDVGEAYVEGDITYLLIALSSESLGVGARSMTFLNPTADSLVSDVAIEPGCGILSFEAKLQEALGVPQAGPWRIDWSGLELDGQGHPTSFAGVDQLLVGFYPDRDQQSIEDKIFDIEQDATPLYELPLTGGTSADLADARQRGDATQKFSGFEQDSEGTWLLALTCSTCQNPQPIVLTMLEPTAP